ncbi:hypothetical protein ACLOJK_003845, partial [Asimina triloba]
QHLGRDFNSIAAAFSFYLQQDAEIQRDGAMAAEFFEHPSKLRLQNRGSRNRPSMGSCNSKCTKAALKRQQHQFMIIFNSRKLFQKRPRGSLQTSKGLSMAAEFLISKQQHQNVMASSIIQMAVNGSNKRPWQLASKAATSSNHPSKAAAT